VGPGGRKNKHNNPGPQAEEKDNEHHRASERDAGYEEVAGRVKSCTDTEAGKTGPDGTSPRESNMEMIAQLEEEKKNMVQTQEKCVVIIQEEVTTQALEALTEKSTQVQAKGRELAHKFHSLAEVVEGAHNA
jgi:hypothetical protein